MAQSTLRPFLRARFRLLWAFVAAGVIVALGFGAVHVYRSVARGRHLRAAAEARARKDYEEEHRQLLACLAEGGATPEVYLQAARSARHLRSFDEAQRLLKQCEALRGPQPDPAVNLERLLLGVQSGNLRHDDALIPEYVRQAPEGDPAVAELLQFVAEKYIQDYMLGSARKTLTLWVERDPKNVAPLLLRGWVESQLTVNAQPAIPDFQKAVELEPDNHVARLRLAEAYLTIRRAGQAVPQLEAVRRQRPDDPLATYHLAFCRLDVGEAKQAQDLLDQFLLPERLALVEELAACTQAAHPVPAEVAAADWYRALMAEVPYGGRDAPDYVVSLFVKALAERARAARATGADAEPSLREAVKLDPFDYQPVYQLVVFLEGHGREQEAKPIRSQMGAIRAEQDRMKETTEKILERPSDPEPRCTAAQIQLRIHQPEQARLWLASALRRAPGYPRALRLMEEYERIKRRPVPGCSADGTGEPGQKKP